VASSCRAPPRLISRDAANRRAFGWPGSGENDQERVAREQHAGRSLAGTPGHGGAWRTAHAGKWFHGQDEKSGLAALFRGHAEIPMPGSVSFCMLP
jgi:hypothetical protein